MPMPNCYTKAVPMIVARGHRVKTVYSFLCNTRAKLFFTSRHPTQHKGFCSVGCFKYKGPITTPNGYIIDRGVYQHRAVVESKINRKLRKNETAHHIDHNRRNNNKTNLIVVSLSENNKLNSRIWKEIRKSIPHKELVKITRNCLRRIRSE